MEEEPKADDIPKLVLKLRHKEPRVQRYVARSFYTLVERDAALAAAVIRAGAIPGLHAWTGMNTIDRGAPPLATPSAREKHAHAHAHTHAHAHAPTHAPRTAHTHKRARARVASALRVCANSPSSLFRPPPRPPDPPSPVAFPPRRAQVDEFSQTALHYAAAFGHLPCVTALARFGADVYASEAGGRTAAELASAAAHAQVASYLRRIMEAGGSDSTHDGRAFSVADASGLGSVGGGTPAGRTAQAALQVQALAAQQQQQQQQFMVAQTQRALAGMGMGMGGGGGGGGGHGPIMAMPLGSGGGGGGGGGGRRERRRRGRRRRGASAQRGRG